MKYFIKDKNILAFFKEKATPDFWDKHWEIQDLKKYILNYNRDGIFLPQVIKFLPKDNVVLDGGCGRGQLVNALTFNGYKAVGIDFAAKTVETLNKVVPELDIRFGNVRNLPLDDESIDGYISAGVIEHFWDGYNDIINEMYRVLKKGGYLFITFPSMSLIRKAKVNFRFYPITEKKDLDNLQDKFYQFILDSQMVINDLSYLGFNLVKVKKIGGLKGLKDEVSLIKPLLQLIYNSRFLYPIHYMLNKILSPVSNHMTLLIFKKND